MKKLIYTMFLLLGATTAMAQENRGSLIPAKIFQRSLMVGGSISGAHRTLNNVVNDQDQKTTRQQFDVAAKVGYFVLHDVALGGKLSLNHHRQRASGDQDEIRSTFILAGPFARYYLDNGFYGEGSFAMGLNNQPSGVKSDVYEVAGGVGYAFFINPKVAIEPAVHLTYLKEKRFDTNTRYFTEFGPSLSIGMQIYLYRERGLEAMR